MLASSFRDGPLNHLIHLSLYAALRYLLAAPSDNPAARRPRPSLCRPWGRGAKLGEARRAARGTSGPFALGVLNRHTRLGAAVPPTPRKTCPAQMNQPFEACPAQLDGVPARHAARRASVPRCRATPSVFRENRIVARRGAAGFGPRATTATDEPERTRSRNLDSPPLSPPLQNWTENFQHGHYLIAASSIYVPRSRRCFQGPPSPARRRSRSLRARACRPGALPLEPPPPPQAGSKLKC